MAIGVGCFGSQIHMLLPLIDSLVCESNIGGCLELSPEFTDRSHDESLRIRFGAQSEKKIGDSAVYVSVVPEELLSVKKKFTMMNQN